MQGFSYTELVNAIQRWPVATSDQYIADIPRLISLGELRLIKDLNLDSLDLIDENLLAQLGDRLVVKPSGMIVDRDMWAINQTTNERTPVLKRSLAYCRMYATTDAVEGTPKYYADLDEVSFYVVPTPDDDYDIELHYVARPDGLSVDVPNTWLGDNAGDLLFECCLMEAEHYLKADDRYADMKARYYDEKLPVARTELRNALRSGDYNPIRSAAKTVE